MVDHDLVSEDYKQPDFYRFDEDSILLANFIVEELKAEFKVPQRFLEIGAGCGVISLELSQKLSGDHHCFDLVEIEKDFEIFLRDNCLNFGRKEDQFNIHLEDFLQIEFFLDYSCVFSNPPYFFFESSRASKDEKRDACRRIPESHWLLWLEKMSGLTSKGGDLFFCHKKSQFSALEFGMKGKKPTLKNQTYFYHWIKI